MNGYSGGPSDVTGPSLGSRAPEAKAINHGIRVDSLRFLSALLPDRRLQTMICRRIQPTSVMQYRIFQAHFKSSCTGLLVCFILVKCICFRGSYPHPPESIRCCSDPLFVWILRHRRWLFHTPLTVILMLEPLARKRHTTILSKCPRYNARKCIGFCGSASDSVGELTTLLQNSWPLGGWLSETSSIFFRVPDPL